MRRNPRSGLHFETGTWPPPVLGQRPPPHQERSKGVMNGYKIGPRSQTIPNGFREAVTDADLQTLRFQIPFPAGAWAVHRRRAPGDQFEARRNPPAIAQRERRWFNYCGTFFAPFLLRLREPWSK